MNPRLATSGKWTSLPKELQAQIKDIFSENFADAAQLGKFVVEGRIYSKELMLRVGYLENGRIRQANFEVSLDFDPNKQNALNLIHLAVDCAASLMQEYFDQEQEIADFPTTWSEFEVDKAKVYVQASTVNSELESEADRLLGAEDDLLVKADAEEDPDEKEAVISMLGLSGDDFAEEDTSEKSNDNDTSPKKKSKSKKIIH